MKSKLFSSCILMFGVCGNIMAQSWADKTKPGLNNFFEIQKSFYEYQKEELNSVVREEMEERDDAFSKFKRWEHYWETRVDAEGNFPPSTILWTEWENYKNTNYSNNKNIGKVSAANWSFVGPDTFPGGVAGGIGRVNCIAFHPTVQNKFWVGTPAGGLWKTTDAGLTWSTSTDNLPSLGVSDIAIDYSNPNIIYIATGDGETAFITPASPRSVGILKSTDGGLTFSATGLSMNITSQKLTYRILIHPTNPSILLVAASDGLWRSTNGGLTWSNQQVGSFSDIEFKPTDPNYVYASQISNNGTSQIYRSTNGGITWAQVSNFTGITRIDLAVSPVVPNVVSALCVNTTALGGLYGIYSSINSGASFVFALSGNCSNNMLCSKYDASACGGQGVYDLAYTIHPSNTSEIWVAGVNIWKTVNGGSNWNLTTMATYDTILNPNKVTYLHSDKHQIAYHPLNSNLIYTCSDAGLFVSNNGGSTWTDLTNGLGISQMYRLGTSVTNANKFLCVLQDNGLKLGSNSGWLDIMSGDNMEEIIDPIDTNVQYSCALTGYLYRTTNNWTNKTVIANNIPGFMAYLTATGFGPGAWITPFVMDPLNNQTLYIGLRNVFKTNDQGNSWAQISNFGINAPLESMAIAPSNNQIIYAGTYDTLFISNNGGSSWGYITIGNITGSTTDKISYITVNPTNPLMLWLTIAGFDAGNKIFKSSDGGATWANISGTLPNIPVNCSVYQVGSNDGIYIGTDLGVFYKDNSMSDWIQYNTGLPNVQVNELEISYSNNKLWAATFGRGLWKSDLYSAVGISENEILENATLIYPNPSAGTFILQLNKVEDSRLEMYNVFGQLIYETQILSSKTQIDLGNCSSGIYFAKIYSGKTNCLKKISITK